MRYCLIHADKLLFISFLCEQPLTAESLNQSRQVGCEEILKGEAACADHEGVRGVKLLFETRHAAVHAAAAALHFLANLSAILGSKMFNSWLQNVQFSGKNKYFPVHIQVFSVESFLRGFCAYLFPLPSHAVGRNDEAAVLIGMQDAAAVNREAGLGGGVGGSGGVVGLGGLDAYG